jgi:hypothetical protein
VGRQRRRAGASLLYCHPNVVVAHACRLGAEGIVSKKIIAPIGPVRVASGSRFAILPASRCSDAGASVDALSQMLEDDDETAARIAPGGAWWLHVEQVRAELGATLDKKTQRLIAAQKESLKRKCLAARRRRRSVIAETAVGRLTSLPAFAVTAAGISLRTSPWRARASGGKG